MSEHGKVSPGPWSVKMSHRGPDRMHYSVEDANYAPIVSWMGDYPEEANAHLIAAAPDLLDVLRTIQRNRAFVDDGAGLVTRPCRACGEATGWPINDVTETVCEDCLIAAAVAKAEGLVR